MYFQNPNYFGQAQYGMMPQQMPKAKYTQPLTPEIISKLRSSGDSFEIKVSQEDLWRSSCTHKENGTPTLVSEGVNPATGNDILRCTICGEIFELVDTDIKAVEDSVNNMINLLQTSKTMYLDAPADLIKQFYQMIPLLKMFPKLYERSQKNFAMYENALGMNPGQVPVGTNGFQMMGAMLAGNPYAGMPGYAMPQNMMYQQPMMAPQQAQPMGYQAPQQPWGYQQPMGQNPFMYGNVNVAPAPAPQPAPAPGVVPSAPVADASTEVVQQKQFNV